MHATQPISAAEYPDIYNREAAAEFEWNETRVGIYSQPLGIVQRLIDKHSRWGKENAIGALIPEALTVSLRGFPYVMPDMIGGNQYDKDEIDRELLIRWAQASALMPLIQFSVGPWHFDKETVRLAREASELHIKFTPYIFKLAQAVPRTGEPILMPLWYHAPDDPETYLVMDQFMLGGDVVVAPVVEKGVIKRDIYLPAGTWRDYKSGKEYEGGRWIRGYPAPLDTLPILVRQGSTVGTGPLDLPATQPPKAATEKSAQSTP
jgi:myogenesis-regulating glycosidase